VLTISSVIFSKKNHFFKNFAQAKETQNTVEGFHAAFLAHIG